MTPFRLPMHLARRAGRRLGGLGRRPALRMTIELTNRCNFRCTYCPHSTRGREQPDDANRFDRPFGFMGRETFELCLDNAAKYAESVSFSFFGEQMLHPHFAEWIAAIPDNRPYRLVTNTNGSLLTDENAQALRKFDVVRFSIDAMESAAFDRLRPGGAVLTIEGRRGDDRFGALAEQIERWLGRPDHPHTQLVYVTTDANRDDRQAYLDYWLPRMPPGDCVVVKSMLSYGGIMDDPYLSDHPCTIPEDRRMNVAWNGDVTPCNLDVNVALCIGNLHDLSDLMAMRRTPRFRAVMAGIRRREGICRHCRDANNHSESIRYWGERGTGREGTTRLLSPEEVCAVRRAA